MPLSASFSVVAGVLLAFALTLASPARGQAPGEQETICGAALQADGCRAASPPGPAYRHVDGATPLPAPLRPLRSAGSYEGRAQYGHPRDWDRGVWIGAGVGCLVAGVYSAVSTNIREVRPAVARGCAIGALGGGLLGYALGPARRRAR